MPANDVMARLGNYTFSIQTAAYEKLRRVTEYRWAMMPRIEHRPSHQWIGIGVDEIEFTGVIYTWYRGGINQLVDMRSLAASGQPQLLVTGYGHNLGYWVIIAVDEGQVRHTFEGAPLKMEFGMRIRNFGEEIEAPGTRAFVLPVQTLYGSGTVLGPPGVFFPPPVVVDPLSIVVPPITPAQLAPLAAQLQQAGTSAQQAAQAITKAVQVLRAINKDAADVKAALTAAGVTYEQLEWGLVNDPVGTMQRLLTGSSGLTTAGLSTLLGGDPALVSQIGQVGQALSLVNQTQQLATGILP